MSILIACNGSAGHKRIQYKGDKTNFAAGQRMAGKPDKSRCYIMSGTSLQPPASPWIGNDRKYITVKMTIQRPSLLTAEPTWSQLYPPHAGWIRRLDTSRSGFLHTALPAATAHNGNRFKGKTLIKLMWQCLICGCYGVSNRAEPITVFYLRVTGSASKVYVL